MERVIPTKTIVGTCARGVIIGRVRDFNTNGGSPIGSRVPLKRQVIVYTGERGFGKVFRGGLGSIWSKNTKLVPILSTFVLGALLKVSELITLIKLNLPT